ARSAGRRRLLEVVVPAVAGPMVAPRRAVLFGPGGTFERRLPEGRRPLVVAAVHVLAQLRDGVPSLAPDERTVQVDRIVGGAREMDDVELGCHFPSSCLPQ